MNRYYKILISLFIGLSFFFLIEMDVFHNHTDNGSHNECPVCVLNTMMSAIAILSIIIFFFKPIFNFTGIIPAFEIRLIQNYSSYYYPDRAPPQV